MGELSRETSSEWTSGTPDRLTRFWAHMQERYGRSFTEEYGADIPRAWRQSLLSMTPAEAAVGVRELGKAELKGRLPTLGDFERACIRAISAGKHGPIHKALQADSTVAPEAFKEAGSKAEETASQVDVSRLAAALGVKVVHVLASWPRRTLLRGESHPAGKLDLKMLWKARGLAKASGRSTADLDAELLAYNGWTPDDERGYIGATPGGGKGTTPFQDRWRELGGDT